MRSPSIDPRAPRHRTCRVGAVLLSLGTIVTLSACQSSKGLSPGLSGMRTDMTVLAVDELGPYLDARLDMAGKTLDAYVMPDDTCRALFAPGSKVTYVDNGPLGVYRRDDLRCQSMGVGNLLVWRDRSQHASNALAPRGQASYRVVHRGDEYALLRGRFPGAGQIGFTGESDLVAVIPVHGECAAVLERDTASIEYRDKGSRVLSLLGPSGLCDVHGLAQPPPQR